MAEKSPSATETNNWIPWEFKKERPDKVPNCQDTNWLPTLEEGQSTCKDGQNCYYFSCGKCISLLALDTFNSRYRNSIEYIPRISCTEPPEPFTKDNKYYQYEGEVFDIYFRFFAQIEELTGVAINGFRNEAARKIFDHVGQTFGGRKFDVKSKDFEIDWILFNGVTVTVIEVKVKADTGKNNENFEKKIDQIKKNRTIIQHLLEVTGCKDIKVNYIIACPNVSIKEVTEGRILSKHHNFFQSLTLDGSGFAFISEESLAEKGVYSYIQCQRNVAMQPFADFIKEPLSVLEPRTIQCSSIWGDNYKLMASSVVISMLLIGGTVYNAEGNRLITEQAYQMNDKKVAKERGSATKRSKNMRLKTTDVPDELWKNYPEFLILGPDQMEAIKCKKNKVALTGEPGCGKTFVLLALLFIHTAKCRNRLQFPGFKKTSFVIPEIKTEFRKYVQNFIKEYCDKNFAVLVKSVHEIDTKAELVLLDEMSFDDDNICTVNNHLPKRDLRIYWAIAMPTSSPWYQSEVQNFFRDEWDIFPLSYAYRCPSNISRRCSKLRREFASAGNENLFRTSTDSTVQVFDDREFKILSFTKSIFTVLSLTTYTCKDFAENNFRIIVQALPEKELEKESLLLVIVTKFCYATGFNFIIKYLKSKFHSTFVYTILPSKNREEYLFKKLPFTGVQYHTVVIIFLENDSDFRISELLYHAVSRALRRVLIIRLHPMSQIYRNEFFPSLSLDKIDIHVLLKLKKRGNLSQEEFKSLIETQSIRPAVEILVLSNNGGQWDFFKTNWEKYMKDDSIAYFEREDNLIKFVSCLLGWIMFPGLKNASMILQPYIDGFNSNEIIFDVYNSPTYQTFYVSYKKRVQVLKQIKGLISPKVPPLIYTLEGLKLSRVLIASVHWQDSDTFWLCANHFVDQCQRHFIAFKMLLNRLPIHLQLCFKLADIDKVELTMFKELKTVFEKYQAEIQELSSRREIEDMEDKIMRTMCLADFSFAVWDIVLEEYSVPRQFSSNLLFREKCDVVRKTLNDMYSVYTTSWETSVHARHWKDAKKKRRLIKALKFMINDMETTRLEGEIDTAQC